MACKDKQLLKSCHSSGSPYVCICLLVGVTRFKTMLQDRQNRVSSRGIYTPDPKGKTRVQCVNE